MTNALRASVVSIGDEVLGIKAKEVGTHSIKLGAAKTMHLGECPVYTIIMIGRWSSDSFLRYIWKQVEQFSHNVSSRMLRFEMHRHIPDMAPQISHLNPWQRNHPGNAETRTHAGSNLARCVRLPSSFCSIELGEMFVFVDGRSIFLPNDSGEGGEVCIRFRFQSQPWVYVHISCLSMTTS